jgi:hypothetical protein
MENLKKKFSFLAMSLLLMSMMFGSCEKDITVKLSDPAIRLVVEGYITPGKPAYVFISTTAAVFDPVDTASLLSAVVKDALVTITDGQNTDTLLAPDPGIGYLYVSPDMTGEIGKTYLLRISTPAGFTAQSVTTIPVPVSLDSIWYEPQSADDTLGYVWATITDPPAAGNSYRWAAKRLGKDNDFIAPVGSVFDDKFFNGLTFEFAYNRGKVPNSTAEDDNNEEEGFFKKGDSIVVRFSSITPESFDFWRAAENQSSSNGSPFSSPAPLNSNISGAIGIWEGFSYTLDTTVAY